jgi:hypothetical protein
MENSLIGEATAHCDPESTHLSANVIGNVRDQPYIEGGIPCLPTRSVRVVFPASCNCPSIF